MGRADRKRRSRGSGGGAPPTHTSNAKANRWQTELNEALEILDAWDDAADEELAAVYMQLESILWKREEATMVSERQAKKGPAASEADSSVADVPWDRVVGVFDKGCRHEKVGVRCSAWEAAVDCCLVEPQLREALEDSDFHRLAWMQLGAAATADALPPSGLLATLFAFLQMTTEASEAAVAAVGSEDLAAVVALASRVPVHHNCAAAALELLLVLSDPTVIEDAGGEDLPRERRWRSRGLLLRGLLLLCGGSSSTIGSFRLCRRVGGREPRGAPLMGRAHVHDARRVQECISAAAHIRSGLVLCGCQLYLERRRPRIVPPGPRRCPRAQCECFSCGGGGDGDG